MRVFILIFSICAFISCKQDDDPSNNTSTGSFAEGGIMDGFPGDGTNGGGSGQTPFNPLGCPGVTYPEWSTSPYVLPYPVGKTYSVALSHCTSSYHSPGQPDQFAIDFRMEIGTLITATREGTVIYVRQSGQDFSFPNNIVVVRHGDGTYAQYMHLTNQGAIATVDSYVAKGDSIGYSGATGLAGYPHLHYVVTQNGWNYPYDSAPYNFSNTTANPNSLISGRTYTAEPY